MGIQKDIVSETLGSKVLAKSQSCQKQVPRMKSFIPSIAKQGVKQAENTLPIASTITPSLNHTTIQ